MLPLKAESLPLRDSQSPSINLPCTTLGLDQDSTHLVSNCKSQRSSSQTHKVSSTKKLTLKPTKLTTLQFLKFLQSSPSQSSQVQRNASLHQNPYLFGVCRASQKNTSHKTSMLAYPYQKHAICKPLNLNTTNNEEKLH